MKRTEQRTLMLLSVRNVRPTKTKINLNKQTKFRRWRNNTNYTSSQKENLFQIIKVQLDPSKATRSMWRMKIFRT